MRLSLVLTQWLVATVCPVLCLESVEDMSHHAPQVGTFQFGAEPATGSILNSHFALLCRSIKPMLDFYTKVFGLRVIFYWRPTDNTGVYYLTDSTNTIDGSDTMLSSISLTELRTRTRGHIELIHANIPYPEGPERKYMRGFSHYGFSVPDIKQFQRYLKREFPDIKILNDLGEPAPALGHLATTLGFGEQLRDGLGRDEFEQFAASFGPAAADYMYFNDPEGNLIEVQERE